MEVRSDYPLAVISLARAERAAGKRDAARELWLLLLQARPWDLEARYQLGTLLWETGDVDGAYRELSQVVRFWPNDQRVRRALVVIHANRGDFKALVAELEKVVELSPADLEVRLDLAAAYASLGRDDQAISAYIGVIAAHPGNVHALKLLGDLYRQKGQLPSAIKYYALALQARPSDPRPYFLLGAAYLETGDDVQAKRVYLKAQRFREFLPEVHNNLGAISYREGKLKESLAYLKKAVDARPNRVRYRYNYALSLSKTEAMNEALFHIEAGLKLDAQYPELHYLRGVVLLRKGDAHGARKSFEKTLELEPEHAGAQHNLERLDQLERREREGEVSVEEPE
jgi:Flp pilus assembly protein TadD